MLRFWNDEAGVVISAELVFILTVLVIGLVCGLVELQAAINSELDDISNAVGSLNQSYAFGGCSSKKHHGGLKSFAAGSAYSDSRDECDAPSCAPSDIGCDPPTPEKKSGHGHHHH